MNTYIAQVLTPKLDNTIELKDVAEVNLVDRHLMIYTPLGTDDGQIRTLAIFAPGEWLWIHIQKSPVS